MKKIVKENGLNTTEIDPDQNQLLFKIFKSILMKLKEERIHHQMQKDRFPLIVNGK
jgi:hypothetical protein